MKESQTKINDFVHGLATSSNYIAKLNSERKNTTTIATEIGRLRIEILDISGRIQSKNYKGIEDDKELVIKRMELKSLLDGYDPDQFSLIGKFNENEKIVNEADKFGEKSYKIKSLSRYRETDNAIYLFSNLKNVKI